MEPPGTLTAMSTDDVPRRGGLFRKLSDNNPNSTKPRHTDRATGEPAKYPLRGVVWQDEQGRIRDLNGDPLPPMPRLRLSTTLVANEPWIELVNVRPVTKPSGPAHDPWNGQQPPHTFLQADEVVLHMIDPGRLDDTSDDVPVDHRYKVVRQPDKYGADGKPTDAAGDPTAELFWAYDLDLIGD